MDTGIITAGGCFSSSIQGCRRPWFTSAIVCRACHSLLCQSSSLQPGCMYAEGVSTCWLAPLIMVSPRPTRCWARGDTPRMAIKEGNKLLQQTLTVQSRRKCSCTHFCHRATRISAAKQGITRWVHQQTVIPRINVQRPWLCHCAMASTAEHSLISLFGPPTAPASTPLGTFGPL